MRLPMFALLVVLAVACDTNDRGDRKLAEGVKPPQLANREEILAQRQTLANQLLAPGDSIIVPVYLYVDSLGMPHQPEIKLVPLDPRIHQGAIALVRNMRFQPATRDGRPTTVMLTVPVKLVRH